MITDYEYLSGNNANEQRELFICSAGASQDRAPGKESLSWGLAGELLTQFSAQGSGLDSLVQDVKADTQQTIACGKIPASSKGAQTPYSFWVVICILRMTSTKPWFRAFGVQPDCSEK